MGFHKCTEPGCRFSLPDIYISDKCPWHTSPRSSPKKKILITAGAFIILGAGYGLSKVIEKHKTNKYFEKVKEEQKKWRKKLKDRVVQRKDREKNSKKETNLEERHEHK